MATNIDEIQDELDQLRVENEVLKTELEAAKTEADNLNPVADISGYIWEKPEDVSGWFNDEQLLESAARERSSEARDRFRRGLPPLPEPTDAQRASIITQQQAKIFARRQRPPQVEARRVVKMLHPNTHKISEIPYEPQINNIAGSLADGLVRYQRKGFKQVDPFLCCRSGCWRPAQVSPVGEFEFGGYCSNGHRSEVEGRVSEGVDTTKLLRGVAIGG